MSNDFNMISSFKPRVENTFLGKGGGGGGAGYFQQGRKKKEKEEQSILGDLMDKKDGFQITAKFEDDEPNAMLSKITKFFTKLM